MGVRHVVHLPELLGETTASSNTGVNFTFEDLGLPSHAAIVGVSIEVRILSNAATQDLVFAYYPLFRDSDGTVEYVQNSMFTREVPTGGSTPAGYLLASQTLGGPPLCGNAGFRILAYGKSSSSWGGNVSWKLRGTLIVEY